MKKNLISKLLPFIALAVALICWQAASAAIGSEYILPSVGQTFTSLVSLLKSGEFYRSFAFTALRSLIAFLISFASGFALALIKSRVPLAGRVIEPIIGVIRALPTIAIILLLLFWTNSRVAPIIVTMLVVLPTAYTHLLSAMEGIDKTSVEAAMVDGADRKQIFLFIEFPQIAPAFYKAIGSEASLNFKLMVAAEVLAQTAKSIGYLLNTSKVYFEIARMLALVCACVAVCVSVELVFNKISDSISDWR